MFTTNSAQTGRVRDQLLSVGSARKSLSAAQAYEIHFDLHLCAPPAGIEPATVRLEVDQADSSMTSRGRTHDDAMRRGRSRSPVDGVALRRARFVSPIARRHLCRIAKFAHDEHNRNTIARNSIVTNLTREEIS